MRTWAQQSVFFLSCLLGTYLVWHLQNLDQTAAETQTFSQSNIMRSLKARQFDPEGLLTQTLSADQWTFDSQEETSLFEQPEFVLLQDAKTWQIRAEQAKSWHSSLARLPQKIDLSGAVLIERFEPGLQADFKLTADKLDYFPSERYAQAFGPVELEKPGLIIRGLGLKAFLDEGRLEVLDEVKTQYLLDDILP